jgi:hypothetical protein
MDGKEDLDHIYLTNMAHGHTVGNEVILCLKAAEDDCTGLPRSKIRHQRLYNLLYSAHCLDESTSKEKSIKTSVEGLHVFDAYIQDRSTIGMVGAVID